MPPSFSIFPLGDQALVVDFGNQMNNDLNRQVHQLYQKLKSKEASFIKDLVPSFSALGIYYDPEIILNETGANETCFDLVASWVEAVVEEEKFTDTFHAREVSLPVCYDFSTAPDLDQILKLKDLSHEEFIQLHTEVIYDVYMLGFLPGFPYMGKVDQKISLPRRTVPRKEVPAGSVGIAGRQTGIYPMASPGGWQLIGRTPVKIFDAANADPAFFQPGDRVRFISISLNEFKNY
ncbi:MAG: 5-oxoprolinase subunit PxpB [Flavisolibacter sp.]|jgi:inhibitor of KinA|nr:5-oxoprolinase subunit PxpB [Flavisolibacter sp.]